MVNYIPAAGLEIYLHQAHVCVLSLWMSQQLGFQIITPVSIISFFGTNDSKGCNFQSSKPSDILKMHQMRLIIVSTHSLEITITCTTFSLELFRFILLYFVCLKLLLLLSSPKTTAKFTRETDFLCNYK